MTPPDNEIWYTSIEGTIVSPHRTNVFGASIVSNEYNGDQGVITFGNPVTSIGDYAFCNCSSLTFITIPNSITSIGMGAFDHCFSLTSITIPNNVANIVDFAFSYCTSLASITFEGTIGEWNNITKGFNWNDNVPATYVQCFDGQVTL